VLYKQLDVKFLIATKTAFWRAAGFAAARELAPQKFVICSQLEDK
jgi:hypothetical protein